MKIIIKYISLPLLVLLSLTVMTGMSGNPEKKIEGEWKEATWEYEKADKNDTVNADFKNVSGYVKEIASQNLVIHKAEKWTFMPGRKLILEGKDTTKELTWTIKGRGNILELKYNDHTAEHYTLTELSNDKLVLNFNTNTDIRGIARLTFEKTK
jgi:hypothetical protein